MPGGVSEYTQDARNGDKEDRHLYPPFCDSVTECTWDKGGDVNM